MSIETSTIKKSARMTLNSGLDEHGAIKVVGFALPAIDAAKYDAEKVWNIYAKLESLCKYARYRLLVTDVSSVDEAM